MPEPPPPHPNLLINNRPLRIPAGPLRSATLHAAGLPKLYDPGYATTAAYTSSITYIDGNRGILRHRGYDISDLALNTTFHQVAHLLLFSALPSANQLTAFRHTLAKPRLHPDVMAVITSFDRSAHPMAILIAALSALGAVEKPLNPAIEGASVYSSLASRKDAITKALGLFPVICAGIFRHRQGLHPPFLPPLQEPHYTYAERFLLLATGEMPRPELAAALDMLLLIHADHEQNCSTATVRQLSSSGVDVFSSLCGGVAALYGPLHGGASEAVLRMLQRIGSPHRVHAFLEKVKKREERLMGFGHRVYKNFDPRARIIQDIAYRVFKITGKDPLIDVATALEKAALADEYFVKRKLYPNVDFYSGVIYKALGFSPEFYPVFFALGRCAGWLAHWCEFLDDPDRRIARPHQRFVGEIGPLKVPPLEDRDDGGKKNGVLAKL